MKFDLPFSFSNVTSSGNSCRGNPSWTFCRGFLEWHPMRLPTTLYFSRKTQAAEDVHKLLHHQNKSPMGGFLLSTESNLLTALLCYCPICKMLKTLAKIFTHFCSKMCWLLVVTRNMMWKVFKFRGHLCKCLVMDLQL